MKTPAKKTLGITLFCGAALTGIVFAASVAAEPGGKHARKAIELADVEARIDERFNAADTDGDGRLSLEELQAAKPRGGDWERHERKLRKKHKRMLRKRAQMDGRDGEHGTISDAERAERDAAVFAAMDADGSGTITSDEFSREKLRDAKRGLRREHRFERLDADDSGFIERAEFGQRLERLRAADADGDGIVTREEMRNAYSAHKRG